MSPLTRKISWNKAALKAFGKFPTVAQLRIRDVLTVAAEGGKSDIAKPMKGLGSGVFEIALPYAGNAYRTVYAVEFADAIWVIHAFQKNSPTGIKTARKEIDAIRERLKRLREMQS